MRSKQQGYCSAIGASMVAVVLAAGCIQGHQGRAASSAAFADQPNGCARVAEQEAQWRGLNDSLRAQGLALRARCTPSDKDWTVQLVVVDSARASEALRGPLADGEPVDMGSAPGTRARTPETELSPDVQYNRDWLRNAMARHHFQAASADGWRFAPVPSPGRDLAAH